MRPVRDHALTTVAAWFNQLETAATEAQAEQTLNPDDDPTQIAFELDSYLLLANAHSTDRLLQSIAPANTSRITFSRSVGSRALWQR